MSHAGGEPTARARLEITNRLGLHMRAARLLIQAVEKLDVKLSICKDDQTVNGKSIIGLMMLAAGQGSSIDVIAEGPDSQAAVDAIAALVEDKFGESS